MIAITDTNIIFSALANPNSVVAKILKDKKNFQFTAPDYLLDEVKKHWKEIEAYSILDKKALQEEWKNLQAIIKFVNVKEISKPIFNKSLDIVKDIDEFDLYFVALHFQIKHKIWTGDKALIKGLKAKGYDICVTTAELKQKLYKK